MLAKKLLHKAIHHHHHNNNNNKDGAEHGNLMPTDFDPHIQLHLGIPSTSSVLAVDPIQRLLALGTLDGRIKVIGRDNNEALFISPKQSPYKSLEFLHNQGYLVGILIDNDIEVWNLEKRCITCNLQWESNITAVSIIPGSPFLLLGDEYGVVSVVKFSAEDCELVETPYQISPDFIAENAGVSFSSDRSVIGVLPQPCSPGNRLLIAYQNGLIILWDVLEAKVVISKGVNDLHIKGHSSHNSTQLDTDSDPPLELMNEKEISAVCWASSFGSMLAIGYIDGDILLWNIPTMTGSIAQSRNMNASCNDVVKLQLSSANKRLPIILLRWGESSISQNSCDGQLFVYGGSEIGSEEVITVVNLQWSAGMEALKGVRRVDLALIGSFADMILLSPLRTSENSHFDGLFVLTSPGKLQFYDLGTLSALASQQERTSSLSGIEYPLVVPTFNPQMTTATFTLHPSDGKLAMWLSEMVSAGSTLEEKKWPLTEGMRSDLSYAEEENNMTRIYMVGYRDGSVRIWDATSPILTLVSVIEGQVNGLESSNSNASVTKLDLCASMMTLAVGTESGLVRFYSLEDDVEVTKLHLIKHSEHKVFDCPPKRGPQCRAVFSLVNSSVTSLRFCSSGTKLAVGFKSSRVAVFDTISPSVLFLSDSITGSKSPVISVSCKTFSDVNGISKSPNHSEPKNLEQPSEELLLTLTQDGKVSIVNSKTGFPISSHPFQQKELKAMSMYVLAGGNLTCESEPHGSQSIGDLKGPNISAVGITLLDSQLLLCYENILCLYHMKSIIQGEDNPIRKVKLANCCCWTSIFKKDGNICGLILCYESGVLEVRSCRDLELVTESSLLSVLRWSFRPNMEKTMSATDDGQICVANGSELAVISVSTVETERRFLESLPSLHDKVVATAADPAIGYSEKLQKKDAAAGILGGIVRGLKKEKSNNANILPRDFDLARLEKIFSQPVALDILTANMEGNEEELGIDDIEIDEPVLVASTTIHQAAKGKTTESDRERLFEGGSSDFKPRTRTSEEIMAAYRGAEYASSAAERARNKLLERREKLEGISQRTEELRSGAENFASMANELARTMEARKKWWKI